MEDTTGTIEALQVRIQSAEDIAKRIITAVGQGEFAIFTDFETTVLWSNMIGSSPKRGWGVIDFLLGILSGLVVWPILRRKWDAMCVEFGKERQ